MSGFGLNNLFNRRLRRSAPVVIGARAAIAQADACTGLRHHFGNPLIDKYLPEGRLARESVSALDRLAYMGARGVRRFAYYFD